MKTIKNLETKAIQNVQAVKGGQQDPAKPKPKAETTTLGDITPLF